MMRLVLLLSFLSKKGRGKNLVRGGAVSWVGGHHGSHHIEQRCRNICHETQLPLSQALVRGTTCVYIALFKTKDMHDQLVPEYAQCCLFQYLALHN